VEVWEQSVAIRGHQLTSAAISGHQRDRTSPRSTGIQGELVSTMASSIGGTQSHWSTWCSPDDRRQEEDIRRGHQKGSSEGVIRAFGAHHADLHAYARQPNGTCRARTRRSRRSPRTLGAPRSPRHLPNRANACPYPSVAMHSPPCAKGIEDHQRRSGAIACEKMTIAIRDHQRQSEAIGGDHLLLGTRSIGGGHRREAARASLFGTSAVSACTPPRPWSRPSRRQWQPRRRRSPTRPGR
jgi:hypothetical protein